MTIRWMDVSRLSFNTLLLLDPVQLSWLPSHTGLPQHDLRIALKANPIVLWYLQQSPSLTSWLAHLKLDQAEVSQYCQDDIRQAELRVLEAMTDWIVYALDPAVYDAQPFLDWDSQELLALVDFTGKTVLDIGAGTGRLALLAAGTAEVVFAVEPVANLRRYLKEKVRSKKLSNVFVMDGLITDIPFPNQFADVTMAGHVFGDEPEKELQELARVTKPVGMIILCPGNNDQDNEVHRFLVSHGFAWKRFEEPGEGMKRKYWKKLPVE